MSDNNSPYTPYRQGHDAAGRNEPPPAQKPNESSDSYAARQRGYDSGKAGGA